MSNDSLERLRNRNRASVPPRTESLETSSDQKSELSSNQNPHITNQEQDSSVSSISDVEPSNIQAIEANASQDTKISRYQELKTKASTLRLEESIASELTLFCKREGISREVLVEAMFLYCQKDPSVWESVLKEAHARHEQRQYISNRKRAQSMMERFAEDE